MLLVDGVQVTAKDLATRFDVDLDKILKNSLFQLNPVLKGFDLGASRQKGRAVFRTPNGKYYPAFFMTRDPKTDLDIEIRFASSRTHRNIGEKRIEVFSPRNVFINGDDSIPSTVDEALYFYLYPVNRQSPFRYDNPWVYKHQDLMEEAESKISQADVLFQALSHARSVSGPEMGLFAKGLGIHGVTAMDHKEVSAQLSEWAQRDPVFYMSKVGNQTTLFDGRVMDAIDIGVFVLKPNMGVFRWEWGVGPKKGNKIVDIVNSNEDSKKVLLDFIKSDPNAYYDDIMNAHKSVTADVTMEAFLKAKSGDEPVNIPVPKDYGLPVPTTFKEIQDFLASQHPDGKNPAPVKASEMLKRIEAGEITSENIKDEAKNYISKID